MGQEAGRGWNADDEGTLGDVYDAMAALDTGGYAARHGIEAEPVLTVLTDDHATAIADRLRPRIEGRVVVEIGGGHGLLAMHLGRYARWVFCIEANPVWATSFVATNAVVLYHLAASAPSRTA